MSEGVDDFEELHKLAFYEAEVKPIIDKLCAILDIKGIPYGFLVQMGDATATHMNHQGEENTISAIRSILELSIAEKRDL